MTLKHIDFYDSPVMIELAKAAIKNGTVQPSIGDVVARASGVKKYAATNDLFADLVTLADGLRERGLVSDAQSLESKIVNYKRASIMGEAHPEGDVKIGDASDELGMIETHESAHEKIEAVVRKQPTGKNASLTAMILKIAKDVLVKSADENSDKQTVDKFNQNFHEAFAKSSDVIGNLTNYLQKDKISFSTQNVINDEKVRKAYLDFSGTHSTEGFFKDFVNFMTSVGYKPENIGGFLANIETLKSSASVINTLTKIAEKDKVTELKDKLDYWKKHLIELNSRPNSDDKKKRIEQTNNEIKKVEAEIKNLGGQISGNKDLINKSLSALGMQTIDLNNSQAVAQAVEIIKSNVNKQYQRTNLARVGEVNANAWKLIDTLTTNLKTISSDEVWDSVAQTLEGCTNKCSIISLNIANFNKIVNDSDKNLKILSSAFDFGYVQFSEGFKNIYIVVNSHVTNANNLLAMSGGDSVIHNADSFNNITNAQAVLTEYIKKADNQYKPQLEQINSTLEAFKKELTIGRKYSEIKDAAMKLFTSSDNYMKLNGETRGLKEFFEKPEFKNKFKLASFNKNADFGQAIGGGSTTPASGSAPTNTQSGAAKPQPKGGKTYPKGAEEVDSLIKQMQTILLGMGYKVGSKENPDEADGVWGSVTSAALKDLKQKKYSGLDITQYWVQTLPNGYHKSGVKEAVEKNLQLLGVTVSSERGMLSGVYDYIDSALVLKGNPANATGNTQVEGYDLSSLYNFYTFLITKVMAGVSPDLPFTYRNGIGWLQFFEERAKFVIGSLDKLQPVDQKLKSISKSNANRYLSAITRLQRELVHVYKQMPEPRNENQPIPTNLLGNGEMPGGQGRSQYGYVGEGPDGIDTKIRQPKKSHSGNPKICPVTADYLYLDSPYFKEIGEYRTKSINWDTFAAYNYDQLMNIILPNSSVQKAKLSDSDLVRSLQSKFGLPYIAYNSNGAQVPQNTQGKWFFSQSYKKFYFRSNVEDASQQAWVPIEESKDPEAMQLLSGNDDIGKVFAFRNFLINLRNGALQTALNNWLDSNNNNDPKSQSEHGKNVAAWQQLIQDKLNDITNALDSNGRRGRSGYRAS